MLKINKPTFLKYKKQIQELYALGKKYDKEKDPEKKEILKNEVIKRCNELKPKLNLSECSDAEVQNVFGVSVDNPANNEAENADSDNEIKKK